MEFHDYRLRSYQVAEFGSLITLDLVYDYPGQAVRESQIRFHGVKLYHFVHTTGAIITGIEAVSLAGILGEYEASISAWAKDQGVADWRTGTQQLLKDWSALFLQAWRIDSAIGLKGFVIATSIT
jgi:hypothetical protein